MNLIDALLLTPIVSIPITPDDRESNKQNVDPDRLSISNDIDSNRHMWKKVLYCMVARPV